MCNVWISLMNIELLFNTENATSKWTFSNSREFWFLQAQAHALEIQMYVLGTFLLLLVFANKFINITLYSRWEIFFSVQTKKKKNYIHLPIQTNFDTMHATNVVCECKCSKDSVSPTTHSHEIVSACRRRRDFKTRINAQSKPNKSVIGNGTIQCDRVTQSVCGFFHFGCS